MDAEEQLSREVWRERVRNIRKKRGNTSQKSNVKKKFLTEVANAGGNVEEAKVTDFVSNFFGIRILILIRVG